MKLPAIFAPLRHGPFARYMTGEFVSMIGSWMQVAVQGILLTKLTNDAMVFGWLNTVTMLPMLALTLHGGRAADRYNKRTILLGSLTVQACSAVLIGWLVLTHQIAVWHIFVAGIAVGFATAFEVPAVSALVPELVPKEEMAGAIAIDRSTFHATRLIGPAVGGILVASYGVSSAYFLNAASFLALAAALFSIRVGRVSTEPVTEQSQGIREGLAYVKSDVPTRTMIALTASMTLFVSPFVIITMPYYAKHVLNLDDEAMGFLMAISGIGSLVGSIGLLSVPRGHRALTLKLAAAAIVIAVCGLAAAHSFAVGAGFLILFTIGMSMTFGSSNIVIQERAPDAMRGRVSSISAVSYFGVVTFSGVLLTQAIELFGMRATMAGSAVGYALAATLLLAGRNQLASAPSVPDTVADSSPSS